VFAVQLQPWGLFMKIVPDPPLLEAKKLLGEAVSWEQS
jgi:hypothetical protein